MLENERKYDKIIFRSDFMDIIIGKTAGFCFGVKNAVDNTVEELKKMEHVYCLGELVHNKQVTEDLVDKGVIFIENIEQAKHKAIIRAHGVPTSVYDKAYKLNIELKDLTCPKVLAIHKLAIKYSKENCYIFLVGQKTHPETIGTASFCGEDSSVIENIDDVKIEIKNFNKSKLQKAVVLAQTTISLEKFNSIVEELKKYIEDVEIKNTICTSTKQRQEETKEISKKVECMIIVGGKHSSNSTKLYEIAKKYCNEVFFVETKDELDIKKIKKAKSVGIMAGASTPQKSVKEIVDIIKKTC